MSACTPSSAPDDHSAAPTTIQVWIHSGQESERATIRRQAAEFNKMDTRVRVRITVIPEKSYNGQVQAAALADDLPCVLDFDGPYVYNYAWQGQLMPLDDLLPPESKGDLLPSIADQGTYRGKLYSVGTFDSGLGLYGRISALVKIGARIPDSPASAWSSTEFDAILTALARDDPDGKVLDLKLNYEGEWFAYGFSPALQSAGADLIDRSGYRTADGALNNPAAVRVMTLFGDWFRRGLVDPNLDDAAFTSGRVSLSWAGHWEYRRYNAAWGTDLAVLPLPDFGAGTKSGQGSWNWGITRSCAHPKAAVRFIAFLLSTDQVLAMAEANGAVPGTSSAIERSAVYGPGGPLSLFAAQLQNGFTVPRPKTPAYPIISSVFERTFYDIVHGANVRTTLDRAVYAIDQDIRDNRGYPDVEPPR